MRVLALSIVMLLSTGACGRDESPTGGAPETSKPPLASASAAATAKTSASATAKSTASLAPVFGGSVVLVGDHAVELVLHQSGTIRAQVRSAGGELVTDAKGVKLGVVASGKANARPKAELAWSAPHACFEGKVAGGAQVVPGPVDVSLEISGKASQATLAAVALVVEPAIGGSVMVAGNHSVELVAGVDGGLEAMLRDAAGAEVKGAAGVTLGAKLAARATAPSVALAWNGARARFVGRVAAGVELVPGPVEVALDVSGKAAVGGLAKLTLSAKAAHGGRVVVVGDYSVELVAGAGGLVQAFVFDAQGKAYTGGDLGLALGIGADADLALAPGVHADAEIELAWDPPSLSYEGKLEGDVDLSVRPLRVSLVASGRAFAGAVAGLSAEARLAAKADLDAALDAKAKAGAKLGAGAAAQLGAKAGAGAEAKLGAKAGAGADAKLGAKAGAGANAKLAVTPPKVDVKVKAPAVKANAGATGGAKAGSGAKAGFSFGTK